MYTQIYIYPFTPMHMELDVDMDMRWKRGEGRKIQPRRIKEIENDVIDTCVRVE
jgi:hypothetical protein